jgi:hypothetical protein
MTLSVLAVLLTQQVSQQQAYATSVFSFGYNAGKNDRIDNFGRNDSCPPEFSNHGDCLSYKAGYNAGYIAEGLLHGNDEERDSPPDYSNRDDSNNNNNNNGGTTEDDGEFVENSDNDNDDDGDSDE